MTKNSPDRVLAIAGSDSSGGAGIQADLKTFTALGVFGASVVTAVTAQTTSEVRAVHAIPAEVVREQLDTALEGFTIDALKSGMLLSREIVQTVASALSAREQPNYVLDPVMISESGTRLLETDATQAMIRDLIPLAHVLTPNIPEAEFITSRTIASIDDIREAAKHIHGLGVTHVLIKGGHFDSEDAADIHFDGASFQTFTAKRIPGASPHGTGCTYSAAIAAYLAKGLEVPEAIEKAKSYVTGAIRHAFEAGEGPKLLNHFWRHQDYPS